MSALTVIVPTRERPDNISALVDAWEATATSGQASLVVAVDGIADHPQLAAYDALVLPPWASVVVTTRRRMIGTLNLWATHFARRSAVVGFMGDDHRPRTAGWDEAMIEHCRGHLSIAYCDDGFQGPNLPTSVFVESSIVRRLGFMAPPTLVHLYCDNYWKALGEGLGTLVYEPEVLIEHLHPSAGKASSDASYEASNSDERYQADRAAFEAWDVGADVAKLTGEGR